MLTEITRSYPAIILMFVSNEWTARWTDDIEANHVGVGVSAPAALKELFRLNSERAEWAESQDDNEQLRFETEMGQS